MKEPKGMRQKAKGKRQKVKGGSVEVGEKVYGAHNGAGEEIVQNRETQHSL